MALPNHHQRGDDISYSSKQHDYSDLPEPVNNRGGIHVHDSANYVLVRRDDLDGLANLIRTGRYDDLNNAAQRLVDHAVLDDAAVGSAGDRMLGPDNPVRPMPATDNDG